MGARQSFSVEPVQFLHAYAKICKKAEKMGAYLNFSVEPLQFLHAYVETCKNAYLIKATVRILGKNETVGFHFSFPHFSLMVTRKVLF